MQQSPRTRKPGVTPNDELLVFRRELAQRQPLDVGEEEERHAHHVPEVGVQVVDQLPVGGLVPGLRIRIGSGFNRVSGSGFGFGIRIRIQEGKNEPQK